MDRIAEFKYFQAQTTPFPLAIDVQRAEGSYIFDTRGKAYLDMVAGVSAVNIGHSHPRVVEAIKSQLDQYMHVMVYGEFAQEIPLKLCKLLEVITPPNLTTTYLTNSGTEAIEGAIKLAKRHTARYKLISAKNAYHGSTHGALSLMGNEKMRRNYYPLLPAVDTIVFNDIDSLSVIDQDTAAVVLETIQGSAGFVEPTIEFMQALRARCNEAGALLILDEIQPGFGRTGAWFAFEHYGISPDILVIGKALGAGMPVGAFMAHHSVMQSLTHDPMLGHITTFGGNAVVAAGCLAHLKVLHDTNLMNKALEKEQHIRQRLAHHSLIRQINGKGLMLALILDKTISVPQLVNACLEKGVIFFNLLFQSQALRISPPLTISIEEIDKAIDVLLSVLDQYDLTN